MVKRPRPADKSSIISFVTTLGNLRLSSSVVGTGVGFTRGFARAFGVGFVAGGVGVGFATVFKGVAEGGIGSVGRESVSARGFER